MHVRACILAHRGLVLRDASSDRPARTGSRKTRANALSAFSSTRRDAARRVAKRFNFRYLRYTDDVTIFIKRDRTDTEKTSAWKILISSPLDSFQAVAGVFRAPVAFSLRRTRKIHANPTGTGSRGREGRFVSEVQRISRRHVLRVTRVTPGTDMFCTRVWTESDERPG